MAPKEYWEIPPFEEDDLLWRRIVGHDHEDSEETAARSCENLHHRAPVGDAGHHEDWCWRGTTPDSCGLEMASYAYGVDSSLSHWLRDQRIICGITKSAAWCW